MSEIERAVQTQEILESYPEKVSEALREWRKATLEREKIEGLLYLRFKGEGEKRTAEEIKALVRSSDERYMAVLIELQREGEYMALHETLLAAKKEASLRTAY